MKTIAISGGFSVLHKGHTRLIEAASEYGNVVVILNSDTWLQKKYGYIPVDFESRKEVLLALHHVYDVVMARDDDGTVCDTLAYLRPDYFANGGDRTSENTPELKLCTDIGIKPLFNVGGEKADSSSRILNETKMG